MAQTGSRLGLGDLLAAGARGLSRFTGTLFAVFAVQLLVTAACMVGVAVVLAQAFAHLPMFDQAVDGDLVAIIWCLRHARPTFLATGAVVFGVVLLWQLATWFLAGGLYGVLAERPESRTETARCFGAAGAQTYLAYARLALCSLPGWMLVLVVFGTGMSMIGPRLETALTIPELLGPIALVLAPTFLLLHFLWTVTDYARVELTLRGTTHAPSVLKTYVRSVAYVVRRPVTLVHGALGWLLVLLVTLAYLYLAQGHAMFGAEGAITLFAVRQGVSLLRMAIRIGVMAGQLELGRTRPLPPRRIEVKAEPAA
jgi:hypothetical protein